MNYTSPLAGEVATVKEFGDYTGAGEGLGLRYNCKIDNLYKLIMLVIKH